MLENLTERVNFGRRLTKEEMARIEAQPGILFEGPNVAYLEVKEVDPDSGEYELFFSLARREIA